MHNYMINTYLHACMRVCMYMQAHIHSQTHFICVIHKHQHIHTDMKRHIQISTKRPNTHWHQDHKQKQGLPNRKSNHNVTHALVSPAGGTQRQQQRVDARYPVRSAERCGYLRVPDQHGAEAVAARHPHRVRYVLCSWPVSVCSLNANERVCVCN